MTQAEWCTAGGQRKRAWIGSTCPNSNKFPHGLKILPDGSILFGFDKGNSLQRIDACSRPLWAKKGQMSHSIELDGPDHGWTLYHKIDENKDLKYTLTKFSLETGDTVRSFTFDDVF